MYNLGSSRTFTITLQFSTVHYHEFILIITFGFGFHFCTFSSCKYVHTCYYLCVYRFVNKGRQCYKIDQAR